MPTKFETPEDHRDYILDEFSRLFKAKYLVGQTQHGGRLWRKSVRDMAKEEVLDFVSYVFTDHAQIDNAKQLLYTAIETSSWQYVTQAFNILEYGNIEGALEEDK